MALSRRNGRSRATLLFLILTSITVITLDFRGEGSGTIDKVRDLAADAFAPVRDAADSTMSPVRNVFNGITDYDNLQEENARLKARIADLQGRKTVNRDAAAELKELLKLQRLDWVGNVPTVAARVVSAPVSNFEQTIELDRGSRDGIAVDMPVVTGAGLVGRVVDVSSRRAVVRLITDPASAVGVRVVRSGETAIAQGEGAGRTMSVGFVDIGADVKRGDLAVTSGLEGGSDLYPASIPVGTVRTARKVAGELQQHVELDPVADVTHLRFVKVLTIARPSR